MFEKENIEPTASNSTNSNQKPDENEETNSNQHHKTSTFRLGNFTKSLLAQAESNPCGLSPNSIQNLVNPMRSQFGLPTLNLHKKISNEEKEQQKTCLLLNTSFIEEEEENENKTQNFNNNFHSPLNLNKQTENNHQQNNHQENNSKKVEKPETVTNLPKKKSEKTGDLTHQTNPLFATPIIQKNFNPPTSIKRDSEPSGEIAAIIKPTTRTPAINKQKPSNNNVKKSGWKFSSEHIKDSEYLVIDSLGKGGSGEVSLVIEKSSRKRFALKKINLNSLSKESINECINEVQMLVELKNSDLVVNIFKWEFDEGEKSMKILMEVGYCDLAHSIKNDKHFDMLEVKWTWKRLLTITHFIHQRGIVHSDLKPANFIWVGKDLKIIDFGIASRMQMDHTSIDMISPKGTLNFVSPETIMPDTQTGLPKVSPKSDIWSLGIILYMLIYGKTPFDHLQNPMAKMEAIVKGKIEYGNFDDPLVLDILKKCFQIDYRQRPNAYQLLQHPFFH